VHSLVAPFIVIVLLAAAGAPVVAAQSLIADPAVLHMRAARSADGQWHTTPPGIVRLDRTDTAVTRWRAQPSVPWLTVTPEDGAGPGRLAVRLDAARLRESAELGEVVVSVDGTVIQRVAVHASVVSADQPPLGFFDAPADGTLTAGPVRLFGWVLDDVRVSSVEICRAGDPEPGEDRCADGHGVRVMFAELHVGDRPDVAVAFPGYEHSGPAAWTAVLSMPESGTTATSYSAVARDDAGHVVSLGARTYSSTPAAGASMLRPGPQAALAGLFVIFIVFHRGVRRWLPDRGYESPVAEPASRVGVAEGAALAVIMAAFAWMAVPGLDRSLDYDEMYSASQFIVDQSWWTSATRVQTFNNHFANSVLASAAVRLFGQHEWAIRLPAFLLALGALAVTWRFGRRLAGPATGLCAAALLAASPAFLFWGQTARGFSGLACLTWLSIDAYARASRTGDPRQAHVHTIATALLPLFHLFGLFILAVQYAAFLGECLIARRAVASSARVEGLRRLHRSFLLVGALTVLVFLPSIGGLVADLPISRGASVAASATAAGTVPPGAPLVGAHNGIQWAGLGVELVSSTSWAVLLMAGALMTVGFLMLPRREACLGAAALAGPLLTMWLVGGSFIAYPRFFAYWIPMLTIFIAAGILAPLAWWRQWTSRTRRGATVAVGVMTMAGGLFMAGTWLTSDWFGPSREYREGLARPAGWADSPVAVVGQDAIMFDYYLGTPAPLIDEPVQLDRLLRQSDRLLVAYHDLPRRRHADLVLRDVLMRRCLESTRAIITMFECR